MLFYKMGNGRLIPVAHRGTGRKEILKLQEEDWARSQGGICAVISYNEPRAIYFAEKERGDKNGVRQECGLRPDQGGCH